MSQNAYETAIFELGSMTPAMVEWQYVMARSLLIRVREMADEAQQQGRTLTGKEILDLIEPGWDEY